MPRVMFLTLGLILATPALAQDAASAERIDADPCAAELDAVLAELEAHGLAAPEAQDSCEATVDLAESALAAAHPAQDDTEARVCVESCWCGYCLRYERESPHAEREQVSFTYQ